MGEIWWSVVHPAPMLRGSSQDLDTWLRTMVIISRLYDRVVAPLPTGLVLAYRSYSKWLVTSIYKPFRGHVSFREGRCSGINFQMGWFKHQVEQALLFR